MSRRLFMIWTSPLFRDSIRLLLNDPEIDWLGATSDYTAAKDTILKLQPDTVLFEEVEGAIPQVMEVLEANPFRIRLIGVSLAENKLQVYQREQRTVAQAEDLLRLILQYT